MEDMFLSILNMSLTASYVIAAIMLVRLFLKKAPKVISYALWAVAGFRLIFPFSFESVFSLIPFKSTPIPANIAVQPIPRVDSGIMAVDNAVSRVLPAAEPIASVNPLQIWQMVGTYLWLIGITALLIYSVVSVILIKRQLREAMLTEGNIYEADNLRTPFVLGFIRPKIYVPAGLSTEERSYIILHEQMHIRHYDHLVKLFAFLILCVYWFNPLVWIAFIFMTADMEMSCDERVLKKMGGDIKKAYSSSLLSLAAGRRLINSSPLAFGEGNIKGRIKNVLDFKRPAAWVIAVSAILVVALSVGFAANRVDNNKGGTTEYARTYALENPTQKQSSEKLQAVMLYVDGTAQFSQALISSYISPKCYYSVKGDEMLFSAIIKTEHDEGFFGLKDGDIIARFEIADDNTLMFKSSTIPLFADAGARYVYHPTAVTGNSTYYGLDVDRLSALRTPYVGNNSGVSAIVNSLPKADASLNQRFISIGDDYGSGLAPNTLTLYYEPADGYTTEDIVSVPNGGFAQNALLLFTLVDNLEEVSFAARDSVAADNQLHKDEYFYRWTVTRKDMSVYVDNDWANAWENGKLSVASALGKIADISPSSGMNNLPEQIMEDEGTSEAENNSAFDRVKITFTSGTNGGKSADEFETTASKIVAYIYSTIQNRQHTEKVVDLNKNYINEYIIQLSNDIGGSSYSLYHDTLYNKAYIEGDGGLSETNTDFARYVESLFENTDIKIAIDDTDAAALFKKYGWTLDYQISAMNNKLNNITVLTGFNPNAYYFAYNNVLSTDIGMDMSRYSNSANINVEIYRIRESMPQEFYPMQNCRGIVIKENGKIIGAFISAGRHSAFNACSLKGNSFEKAAGQTLDKWLAEKVQADITDEKLSKLEPEQLIEEYFTALNEKDAQTAKGCISKKTLLGNLTSNMPDDEIFNEGYGLLLTDSDFSNLKSAKLMETALINEPDKNTKTFRITVDLQYDKVISIGSGEQPWDCIMVYESPQTGWKIDSFGH